MGLMSVAPRRQAASIRIASPSGPIERKVLQEPLRDALPAEIPIIDVSPLFSSCETDRYAIARQINDAATNIGFFYIKNHGIPSVVIENVYGAARRFYHQAPDEKLEATIAKSSHYNGYRAPNTQRLNPDEGVDVRESFSVRYDPRLDPLVANSQAVPDEAMEYLVMEDQHFSATAHVLGFRDAVVAYYRSCLALSRALTQSFALSLGLPETAFDSKVAYPDATLNLNYYPPIDRTPPGNPGAKVSIGSHTDFQLFTILWQDMVGGLQVLNLDGQWINAKPVPGTLVVNIADCLQRITNDKYVSTVHRAQNGSGQERISLAYFWGFGLHETCQVLDKCVPVGEDRKYDDIRYFDWLKKRVEAMTQLDDGA